MVLQRLPSIISFYYGKKVLLRFPSGSKKLYITFDDGPTKNVTEAILDTLKKYQATSTFFCCGNSAEKNPKLVQKIIEDGHLIGNHTFSHIKGTKTKNDLYFEDVERCHQIIKSDYFRPPYGRISKSQVKYLSEKYQIVLWSLLTEDYNPNLSQEDCLQKAIKKTKDGDIVVFHNSEKAAKNVLYVLPKYLDYFYNQGFSFEKLP